MHELITHILKANLRSIHIKILNLEEKEKFNITAITRRFKLFETLSRETFSLTDKLRLYFAIMMYFQNFNKIPMELFYSKYVLQGGNLSSSTNQQNSGLILSRNGKESLTEDEVDFINSCLEAYRIQKAKWL
ncbi:hypothetical protein QW71_03260 [Paenibacillus sp. IHB B 3415]|nr:hypothetical protein QW71_03260 [Paenibacillus sp. IHB B 3415]